MSDFLVLCEGSATMCSEFWEFSHQCLGECINVFHHFTFCWGWSCTACLSSSTVYAWLILCRPCHSVSPLRFRHSSRLIQIRTLAGFWRRSHSWTCWRDAGTRISELDMGWSPPAECSKWHLNVAEFKAELPVDISGKTMCLSVRRFPFPWFNHYFQVTYCCFRYLAIASCFSPSFANCSSTSFLRYLICLRSVWCIYSASPDVYMS